MARAYIGLGGNMGPAIDRRFARVAGAIARWPEVTSTRLSPAYWSDPVGPVTEQPRFLNAVVELELVVPVDPVSLMRKLLALEVEHGRDRTAGPIQGPRPIDLDLIMLDELIGQWPGPPAVTLPHPRAAERAFVLQPLIDLVGAGAILPGTGTPLGELAAGLPPLEEADEIAPMTVDHDQPDRDAQGDGGV